MTAEPCPCCDVLSTHAGLPASAYGFGSHASFGPCGSSVETSASPIIPPMSSMQRRLPHAASKQARPSVWQICAQSVKLPPRPPDNCSLQSNSARCRAISAGMVSPAPQARLVTTRSSESLPSPLTIPKTTARRPRGCNQAPRTRRRTSCRNCTPTRAPRQHVIVPAHQPTVDQWSHPSESTGAGHWDTLDPLPPPLPSSRAAISPIRCHHCSARRQPHMVATPLDNSFPITTRRAASPPQLATHVYPPYTLVLPHAALATIRTRGNADLEAAAFHNHRPSLKDLLASHLRREPHDVPAPHRCAHSNPTTTIASRFAKHRVVGITERSRLSQSLGPPQLLAGAPSVLFRPTRPVIIRTRLSHPKLRGALVRHSARPPKLACGYLCGQHVRHHARRPTVEDRSVARPLARFRQRSS